MVMKLRKDEKICKGCGNIFRFKIAKQEYCKNVKRMGKRIKKYARNGTITKAGYSREINISKEVVKSKPRII